MMIIMSDNDDNNDNDVNVDNNDNIDNSLISNPSCELQQDVWI